MYVLYRHITHNAIGKTKYFYLFFLIFPLDNHTNRPTKSTVQDYTTHTPPFFYFGKTKGLARRNRRVVHPKHMTPLYFLNRPAYPTPILYFTHTISTLKGRANEKSRPTSGTALISYFSKYTVFYRTFLCSILYGP